MTRTATLRVADESFLNELRSRCRRVRGSDEDRQAAAAVAKRMSDGEAFLSADEMQARPKVRQGTPESESP